jgi:L-alanine-DL-glutamate epimerase-like enolase superfamily enzyme
VLRGYGDWILLRVETDAGIDGLGECFPAIGGAARPTLETIQVAARLLEGQDPREISRIWSNLYEYFLGRPGSMAGLVTTVLSGIEIALWDLLGKSLGAPLYRLLGGRYRDRVRVYADCGKGEGLEPAAYAEKARRAVALGFTALKFDLDAGPPVFQPGEWGSGNEQPREGVSFQWRDPYARSVNAVELDAIVARVRAVREAVGSEIDIAFDCAGYSVESATRLARALEPFRLLWFEDALPRESVEPFARIKAAASTPLLTGECLYTRFGFKALIDQGCVDMIAPDVQKTGGILETRRIADLASLKYMLVAPHCVATPVGTAASVHLCAAIPNFLVLEYHAIYIPEWGGLIREPVPFLDGGFIRVPEGPGLGVELDYDAARRLARPGEAFFE